MPISFSLYHPRDHQELYSLAESIWKDTYSDILSPDQISYMLPRMYGQAVIDYQVREGEVWEIIRNDEQKMIGYLHYLMKEDELWLSKIYLCKDGWGAGISSQMLQQVIRSGVQRQAGVIRLTVNKNNIRAQKFYSKMGFKLTDEKVFDIGGGYVMDDYIFSKYLP